MSEAMAAHQRGDLASAEEGYRRLTDSFPRFADAWHYYGLLCHQKGESARALELLRRAQALAPEHPVFLFNFGRVLGELGHYSQAISSLGRVLRLTPDDERALIAYAQTLAEAGRGAEATARLERRVRERPVDWRIWALLGECRAQAGDRAGAQQALGEAAEREPAGGAARHLAGAQAALVAGDALTAELEFRAALGVEPRSGAAFLRLAEIAAQAGDSARAREWARAALALDPRLWRAWALLALDSEERQDPAFLDRLEHAARDGEEDPGSSPLHFALGWLNEGRGEYDKAFAAYARGNLIQGRHRRYDRALQEVYVSDIVAALDEVFVRRSAVVGVSDPGAIFVCGMPRSGTTLIEAILSSHPAVTAGGEMRFVHDWLRHSAGAPDLLHKTGSWLRDITDPALQALAGEWRVQLSRAAAGAPRVTDKMPGNYHLLGLIHVCFPDAAIVYVRRDPRDVGLSCFTTRFDHGHYFSHDLESIGHYYRLHEQIMEHWRTVLGSERLIEIEYEALIAQPEREIRRLLSALGLGWDPVCLRFHERRDAVQTASLAQVRQPLYSNSVGRWRRFEAHLGPLLTALAGSLPVR